MCSFCFKRADRYFRVLEIIDQITLETFDQVCELWPRNCCPEIVFETNCDLSSRLLVNHSATLKTEETIEILYQKNILDRTNGDRDFLSMLKMN